MTMPAEGTPAPDFELPVGEAETIRLSGLRDRLVVLYFYPKDDTSGCTRQAREFSGLAPEFEAAGATIVGVSPDSLKSHARFKAKHDLGLTLAADEDKAVAGAYGVWVEKSMYGRRYMGVERTTFLLDRAGTIVRIWPKVRVPGHAEEVLEAVRALDR